eukprot:Gb_21444 [translate_table: standard]
MMSPGTKKKRNQKVTRSSSIKVVGETLSPLMEGPTPEAYEEATKKYSSWSVVRDWVRNQMERSMTITVIGNNNSSSSNRSNRQRPDLKLLLGVLGCPLAPVHVPNDPLPHLSIKDVPIGRGSLKFTMEYLEAHETSSAQYIVQQYMAATGCMKLQNSIRSSYTMGRVKMVSTEREVTTQVCRNYPLKATETGCFVLWQMMPDMWSMELVVAGSKVHAGSNGKIVWRHTPWLGTHAAKGPARPLRRALQGLDPRTTANMFANSRCLGEKRVGDEDCFILKLAAGPSTLVERSDSPAEIIRHVLFGYFSQKTGLLVYMEDSHLTRIQATGTDAVYWETTIETTIKDYRAIDGVMIAHSGRSIVTLFRFGEISKSHTKTRMEETWTIDDVVFNVPGLSMDCFIPPADIIRNGLVGDAYNYRSYEKPKFGKLGNSITQQHLPTGFMCPKRLQANDIAAEMHNLLGLQAKLETIDVVAQTQPFSYVYL